MTRARKDNFGLRASRSTYSAGWIRGATSCDSRRAEKEMLEHFRRATRVTRAASRRRGAGSEYVNRLLRAGSAPRGGALHEEPFEAFAIEIFELAGHRLAVERAPRRLHDVEALEAEAAGTVGHVIEGLT